MTQAWRIVKKKHAASAFDGEGASREGGRWNLKGTPVVYASDSLALAALEQFIHLGHEGMHISFVFFLVDIPGRSSVSNLTHKALPRDWRKEPPPISTKQLGNDWIQSRETVALKAPSVIAPHSYNYLLNPAHPDFDKLEISEPAPFSFDPRMWKE